MSLDSDLYTHLSGVAGLTALTGTRIYPEGDAAEDPTLPYISVSRATGDKEHALGAANPVQATEAEYEFWIVSATKENGRAVRAQLTAALATFTGGATVSVGGVTLRDGAEAYDWEVKRHYTPVEAVFAGSGDV